jgi:hypothetical protein
MQAWLAVLHAPALSTEGSNGRRTPRQIEPLRNRVRLWREALAHPCRLLAAAARRARVHPETATTVTCGNLVWLTARWSRFPLVDALGSTRLKPLITGVILVPRKCRVSAEFAGNAGKYSQNGRSNSSA